MSWRAYSRFSRPLFYCACCRGNRVWLHLHVTNLRPMCMVRHGMCRNFQQNVAKFRHNLLMCRKNIRNLPKIRGFCRNISHTFLPAHAVTRKVGRTRDSGTPLIFAGQSRGMWDGCQVASAARNVRVANSAWEAGVVPILSGAVSGLTFSKHFHRNCYTLTGFLGGAGGMHVERKLLGTRCIVSLAPRTVANTMTLEPLK